MDMAKLRENLKEKLVDLLQSEDIFELVSEVIQEEVELKDNPTEQEEKEYQEQFEAIQATADEMVSTLIDTIQKL